MKSKKSHYYRYVSRNIHILFRLINNDAFSSKIRVIRVYKTTVNSADTIMFVTGKTYETVSFWDNWLIEDNLRNVNKKIGKKLEKCYT